LKAAFPIWPVVQVNAYVKPLLKSAPTVQAALKADPNLFGLRTQGVVVQGGMPIVTNTVRWLEIYGLSHRSRHRDDLSPLEKEALLDMLEHKQTSKLQSVMAFMTPPLKASEAFTVTADITREGVLLFSSAVMGASKDEEGTKAFQDEATLGAKTLADMVDIDLELKMSSQVATLFTTVQEPLSAHNEISRMSRLSDLFQIHIARLNNLLPRNRQFEVCAEWHPPRES